MSFRVFWGMLALLCVLNTPAYAMPPTVSHAAHTPVSWQDSVKWGWTLPLTAQQHWASLGMTLDAIATQGWLAPQHSARLDDWLGVRANTILDAHRATIADFFQQQRWQTRQYWLKSVWKREIARIQAAQALAANAALHLARGQYQAGNISLLQQLPYEIAAQEATQRAAQADYEAQQTQRTWQTWLGVEQGFLAGDFPALPNTLPPYTQALSQAQQYRQDWLQAQQDAANSSDIPSGTRPSLSLPLLTQALNRRPVPINYAQQTAIRLEQQLKQEIWQHWHAAALALQQAHAQHNLLTVHEKTLLQETLKHYNGMLRDSYDVLRQKQALLAREAAFYDAQAQFWEHVADLEYAVRSDLTLEESR